MSSSENEKDNDIDDMFGSGGDDDDECDYDSFDDEGCNVKTTSSSLSPTNNNNNCGSRSKDNNKDDDNNDSDIDDMFGSSPSPSSSSKRRHKNNNKKKKKYEEEANDNDDGDDSDIVDMFGSSPTNEDGDDDDRDEEDEDDQDVYDMFGSPSEDDIDSNSKKRKKTIIGNNNKNSKTTNIIPKKKKSSSSLSLQREMAAKAILLANKSRQQKQQLQQQNSSLVSQQKRPSSSSSSSTINKFYRSIFLENYYKNIRDWDFINDLNESQKQQQSLSSPNNNISNSNSSNTNTTTTTTVLKKEEEPLPNTFESALQYKALWSPLLLHEVRSQILQEVSSDGLTNLWSKGIGLIPVRINNNNINNNNNNNTNSRKSLSANARSSSSNSNSNNRLMTSNDNNDVMTIEIKSDTVIGNASLNRLICEQQFFVNDVIILIPDESTLIRSSKGILLNNNNGYMVGSSNHDNNDDMKKRRGLLGHCVNRIRNGINGLKVNVSRKMWKSVFGSSSSSSSSNYHYSNNSSNKNGILPINNSITVDTFYVAKIGNNITSLREYTALCNMDSIQLCKQLLKAKSSSSSSSNNNVLDQQQQAGGSWSNSMSSGGDLSSLTDYVGFRNYVLKKFNPSQVEAITAAASEYGQGGFTLVKGPPGTGKTTTLVALLNALHLRQYQTYYQEIERIATATKMTTSSSSSSSSSSANKHQQHHQQQHELQYHNQNSDNVDLAAINAAAKVKPRILVCAPSNAAVDNIILKIMEDGFIGGNGKRYNPSIVRIGVGQSIAVASVSLKTQIDNILSDGTMLDKANIEHKVQECRQELKRFHGEIRKLKRRLRALANAVPYDLSRDWEIRIDEDRFDELERVIFVNHATQTTTRARPPPADTTGQLEIPYPAKEMPHYQSLMKDLVRYVERHNTLSMRLRQYLLVKKVIQSNNNNNNRRSRNDNRTMASTSASSNIDQELETHLLNSAHIVLTTLGSAGSKTIESASKFEVVVVDEAAQSSEPSTLVALQLGSSHAVLMGDPQQLPATIFSMSGRITKFDRSLFQRLEDAGHPVHMLNTQYRMDPIISDFPRRIFYDGRLLDGRNVRDPQYGGMLSKTIRTKYSYFEPFTIFDLDSAEERINASLSNADEADLALHLYCSLDRATSGMLRKCRVAIIAPYSQQVSLLRRTFENHFIGGVGGASISSVVSSSAAEVAATTVPKRLPPIEISTIDAFQGKEADIVIFSCVRAAGSSGSIGFLSDVQRMNVALTRAKHFLLVIARVRTIIVNPYWRDLVETARKRGSTIHVPLAGTVSRGEQMNKFPELEALHPLVVHH